MKLVIHPPVNQIRLQQIKKAAGEMLVVNAVDIEQAKEEITNAQAFYGKMTLELLQVAKQLEWVQSPTASLEHYLFPELIEHPCKLTNMRGLFYDVIADHVMGYILCFARNLHYYIRQQSASHWNPIGNVNTSAKLSDSPGEPNSIDRAHIHLADCTVGVIGVGSIGAEVCRRTHAFGMQVIGVDPHTRTVPNIIDEVWDVGRLPELLATSDFVVIAAPHTPETFKLIQRKQLQQMKSTAYLINVGRGVIVDLADLTTSLQQKEIGGVALDVFETEPLPKEHPLWKMENAIITPHVAAASTKVAERHTETLLENIRCFVSGDKLKTEVNKTEWY